MHEDNKDCENEDINEINEDSLKSNNDKEGNSDILEIVENEISDSEDEISSDDQKLEGTTSLFVRLMDNNKYIKYKELIVEYLKNREKYKKLSSDIDSEDELLYKELFKNDKKKLLIQKINTYIIYYLVICINSFEKIIYLFIKII